MQYSVTQGIILKSILFQEKEKILNVYTKDFGMANFIIKGLSAKKSHLFALSTPLSFVELHYSFKNPDWFVFKEGNILDPFLELRSSLDTLQTASSVAKALCDTLLPKAPSPKVFELLHKFFKNLALSKSPSTLAAHFLLKVLSFEGVIHFADTCACQKKSFGLKESESLCLECGQYGNWLFEETEWNFVLQLINMRHYSLLNNLHTPEAFYKKVSSLYYEKMGK